VSRADRAAGLVAERDFDLLLVSDLFNVRYLSGFTGSNGVCLIGDETRIFITDFRYVERSKSEVSDFDLVQGKQDLLKQVVEVVKEQAGDAARLGFDESQMTVKAHERLSGLMPEGAQLVAAGGLVEQLRAVKDDGELEKMRRAAEIADGLYRWVIEEHGLAGHTEAAVARALTRRAQDDGADGVSFEPIVAAAGNGALPHAEPGDLEIPRDTLVVIDLGCAVEGYCSDCTRTFATGDVGDEAREAYELVRSAQAAAVAAVAAGAEAKAVDAAARDEIEQAGRGDQFGHGTGHGVGLEVHEAPRIAPKVETTLESGNVVTIEPGVYVPGKFGIRIEDMVLVTADGADSFTKVPLELITV
jgi:Xaa-Pro aminopeptidase